jgi:hypothetical protein
MSGKPERTEIVLSLDDRERETVARAAGMDAAELEIWARQKLLDAARARIERATKSQLDAAAAEPPYEPPAGQQPCWCGNTRDRHGECDGSCIMSY